MGRFGISTSRPNREAAARYGIDVGAIQDLIETAIAKTTSHNNRRASALSRARALRRNTGGSARSCQRAGDRSHRHTNPARQVADIRQVLARR